MRVLFIGDIVGKPGRAGLAAAMPRLRERHRPDIVIANGENAAGGLGITEATANEIFGAGIDPSSLRGPGDLERIPFTTKDQIAPTRDDPQRAREIVLQPTRDLLVKHSSLGRKIALAVERIGRGEKAVRDRLNREYRPVSVFFTTGSGSTS